QNLASPSFAQSSPHLSPPLHPSSAARRAQMDLHATSSAPFGKKAVSALPARSFLQSAERARGNIHTRISERISSGEGRLGEPSNSGPERKKAPRERLFGELLVGQRSPHRRDVQHVEIVPSEHAARAARDGQLDDALDGSFRIVADEPPEHG